MGVKNIHKREEQINKRIFKTLKSIKNLVLLAEKHEDRLGIFSFYIKDMHYNLGVKILNDRFGIQTRGGCSCAGTYGHFLLHVDQKASNDLIKKIDEGCLIERPGWIRLSIHPTTTDEEVEIICEAIKALAKNYKTWEKDYNYNSMTNVFVHKMDQMIEQKLVKSWF